MYYYPTITISTNDQVFQYNNDPVCARDSVSPSRLGVYPWQILTSGSDLSSGSDDDGQRKRMRVTGKRRGRMTCSASDTEEGELSPAQYVSGPENFSRAYTRYREAELTYIYIYHKF